MPLNEAYHRSNSAYDCTIKCKTNAINSFGSKANLKTQIMNTILLLSILAGLNGDPTTPPPANNVTQTDNEKTKVLAFQKPLCTKNSHRIATYSIFCENKGEMITVSAGGTCSATSIDCILAQLAANQCAEDLASASLDIAIADAQMDCLIVE